MVCEDALCATCVAAAVAPTTQAVFEGTMGQDFAKIGDPGTQTAVAVLLILGAIALALGCCAIFAIAIGALFVSQRKKKIEDAYMKAIERLHESDRVHDAERRGSLASRLSDSGIAMAHVTTVGTILCCFLAAFFFSYVLTCFVRHIFFQSLRRAPSSASQARRGMRRAMCCRRGGVGTLMGKRSFRTTPTPR